MTNAVLHAGVPEYQLTIDVTDDRLRCVVADRGTGTPTPREPTANETAGRGLMLVGRLADRWGIETSPDVKAVWFEVAAPV